MPAAAVVEALDAVVDEATFLQFLTLLAADFEAAQKEANKEKYPHLASPRGWQNFTIETFLDAAVAGADGGAELVAANPWRRCADILFGGAVYE